MKTSHCLNSISKKKKVGGFLTHELNKEVREKDVSRFSKARYRGIPAEKAGPLTTLEFPLRMLGAFFLSGPSWSEL